MDPTTDKIRSRRWNGRINRAAATIAHRRCGLAAIAAITVALGATSSANAERVIKCSANGSCVTVCRQTLSNGLTVDYSEGTVITVNGPDGSRKYKCTNGNWVPTAGSIAGSIVAPTSESFTPVDATCPIGITTCALVVGPTIAPLQP